MESILNALLSKVIKPMSLLWHYRSRHEDLIAFSNHNIYEGNCITFPTPSHDKDPNYGVHFDYVADGRYVPHVVADVGTRSRVNLVEANRVVELVAAHSRQTPTPR